MVGNKTKSPSSLDVFRGARLNIYIPTRGPNELMGVGLIDFGDVATTSKTNQREPHGGHVKVFYHVREIIVNSSLLSSLSLRSQFFFFL